MVSMSLKVSGDLLRKGPAVVQEHVDRLVTKATLFLDREVKTRTPQGVYGAQGGLLGSIQQEVTGKGTFLVRGVVGTAHAYGEVIERGRRPGKMPPPGVMLQWIELKLGVDPMTATRLEFPIRRKIAQKGFEGKAMFFNGLWDNYQRLQEMAQREGLELVMELNNG
ncbi:MAG: hypothetical protein KAT93_06715 [Desulfuromonadales bacterium]|nr:hypothetical protein [Desulfuromonadales bacterium]